MSKPTHNIVYKARSYTDGEGKTRNVYATIGAAWPDDDGKVNRICLDSIPINWDGVMFLRERQEKEEGAQ